jgi:hypothetical protein
MKKLALVTLVLSGVVITGCSTQSPVAPTDSFAVIGDVSARPGTAAPGIYELSFLNNGQPVESLVVGGQELTLKARVLNAATGLPAQSGTVTFQYCSRRGPKNDITRADEAPKEECETGSARWASLVSIVLNENGEAFGGFSVVQIPRTVGFRFQFRSDRSGIAAGVSPDLNFTWVSGS